MKSKMYNSISSLLIVLIFFVNYNNAQSQQIKVKLDNALWYRSKDSRNFKQSDNRLDRYFNFNKVIDFNADGLDKLSKKMLKNTSTLFIVFQDETSAEKDVLLLNQHGVTTRITSDKIYLDGSEVKLEKDKKTGVILTYKYSVNSLFTRKKGDLEIGSDFYNITEGKSKIMELIYFPNLLLQNEQNIVETYLSVKYGISLEKGSNYYDSTYTIVWDDKNHEGFNYRVTGIGRDDFFGLNQFKSGNSQKDGLYVLNEKQSSGTSEDKKVFEKDKAFFMWGDNNESTEIVVGFQGIKKMDRVWSTQVTNTSNEGFSGGKLSVNSKEMLLGELDSNKEEVLWLVVDNSNSNTINYTASKYVLSTKIEDDYFFDLDQLTVSTSSKFSFVIAKDFFVLNEVTPSNCIAAKNGAVKINIIGGLAPYHVKISSHNFLKELDTSETVLALNSFNNGDYKLEVIDSSNKLYTSSFIVDGFVDTPIDLASTWILPLGESLTIKPTISNEQDIISFNWLQGDKLLSSENQLLVAKSGNYSLKVTNKNGCEKILDFVVSDKFKDNQSDWFVFPNPTKSNQRFTVTFNLVAPEDVTISIYDQNGKNLKSKSLGRITQAEYVDSLMVTGTYLIVVNRNGKLESAKIIIQ